MKTEEEISQIEIEEIANNILKYTNNNQINNSKTNNTYIKESNDNNINNNNKKNMVL